MKSSSVTEDEIRRRRGVQREDVWAAADAVLLAGEKPTIERVRQHLGSGSPNTVGPLLEQWFKHLGRRIQDPGAFAAPAGVPDPVLQAARHFWETALAQTRGDFDERLRQGLADAVANVEAEKERAEIAGAAAFEASAKANRLQGELDAQAQLLRRAQEALAADGARLQEVRAALAAEKERLLEERCQAGEALTELKQQVAAGVERADAADRRVAMELDRERSARAKAERQVEALQKAVAAAREAMASAQEQAQQQVQSQMVAAREREDALHKRLAEAEVKLAQASNASAEMAELRASVRRLSSLIDVTGVREPAPRKKTARSLSSNPKPRSGARSR
ncbi:DNA-binding protein [Hydrogenophaga sp.]|uniref:DNA-binding protein n=1 Tax=Hydrogenophaga sp. TaxID=1904254 RepID=UPI001AC91263|nr:DNA-binding protein [Hydrogenophaga sp.]MBN9373622.1 DNA-binding protein [Hydrogenophaga sp.]